MGRKRQADGPILDSLDEPITRDPGDGLGGYSTAQYLLREKAGKALGGDRRALLECLNILCERDLEMIDSYARTTFCEIVPRETEVQASIAPILFLLGLGERRTDEPFDAEDTPERPRVRFCDWIVDEAFTMMHERGQLRPHLDRWHREGSRERNRRGLPQPTPSDIDWSKVWW